MGIELTNTQKTEAINKATPYGKIGSIISSVVSNANTALGNIYNKSEVDNLVSSASTKWTLAQW